MCCVLSAVCQLMDGAVAGLAVVRNAFSRGLGLASQALSEELPGGTAPWSLTSRRGESGNLSPSLSVAPCPPGSEDAAGLPASLKPLPSRLSLLVITEFRSSLYS